MPNVDGIQALIAVCQLKSSNANDEALNGANKQRELVKKQQTLRATVAKFEELVRDGNVDVNDQAALRNMINALNADDVTKTDLANNYTFQHTGNGEYKTSQSGDNETMKANQKQVDAMRSAFDGAMKDLEAEDRMGNFEIQRLMSTFNQMETLSSNVQKKADDTASGQQSKIG